MKFKERRPDAAYDICCGDVDVCMVMINIGYPVIAFA
jgi:hypothetical protein